MRNSIEVNLDIEKIIYVVFIIISVMGIIGTNYEEKFIETGDSSYHEKGCTICAYNLSLLFEKKL